MEIYASEWAGVSLNKVHNCLELVWKKESNSDKYREVLRVVMETQTALKTISLLSDIGELGIISPVDRLWMEIHLLPQAANHGLKNIAMIVPDDIFAKKYALQVKQAAQGLHLNIQHFADTETGREWLSQYSAGQTLRPVME